MIYIYIYYVTLNTIWVIVEPAWNEWEIDAPIENGNWRKHKINGNDNYTLSHYDNQTVKSNISVLSITSQVTKFFDNIQIEKSGHVYGKREHKGSRQTCCVY